MDVTKKEENISLLLYFTIKFHSVSLVLANLSNSRPVIAKFFWNSRHEMYWQVVVTDK